MTRDYGDWKYETDLSGYGDLTEHAWLNEELDGSIRVAPSEGMHIMKCDRGDWQVDVSIGGGGVDKTYCFESEQEALDNISDLLPA